MAFSQSGSIENDVRLRSPNDFGVVLGEEIDKFKAGAKRYRNLAQRKLVNLRHNLQQGPLLGRALERADKIALETGNYKPLAKLAGKRPLYDRMFSGTGHQMGMQGVREAFGLPGLSGVSASGFERSGKIVEPTKIFGKLKVSNLFGRTLGLGFTAVSAYQGYQEEGLWGAAKGVGESVAFQYIQNRLLGSAFSAIGMTAAPLAAVGAVGTGLYMYQKYAGGASWMNRDETYEYRRRNAAMDLGTPSIDPFGNNATIRQRSLSAIQGSRLNGRSMLGNEAFIMYRPY